MNSPIPPFLPLPSLFTNTHACSTLTHKYTYITQQSKEKGTLFKRGNKDNSKRGLENAASTWYKDGPAFLKVTTDEKKGWKIKRHE